MKSMEAKQTNKSVTQQLKKVDEDVWMRHRTKPGISQEVANYSFPFTY